MTVGAARLCSRSELRTRLRTWLALAILAGLLGGVAIAAAASARRTETAVPRSFDHSNLSDVTVQQFDFPGVDYEHIRRLPEVSYSYREDNFFFTGETDAGRPLDVGASGLIASPDRSVGISRGAPEILSGRQANPDAPDEAVADEAAARLLGLEVGDTFTVRFAAPDQLGAFFSDTGDATKFHTAGPQATFTVVGISAVFATSLVNYSQVHLTSAFYERYADRTARIPSLEVYLDGGDADVARFEREVDRLPNSSSIEFGEAGDFVDDLQRGVRIQAGALWVLAALAAVVGALLVAQGLTRLAFEEAREMPTLRAIGMTKGQLVGVGFLRTVAIGLAGALGAAALTVALSPLSPVGSLARKAEPDPGFSVDWLPVAGGALAVLLVVVAAGTIAGWRASRRTDGATRLASKPSAIVQRLARSGASPATVSGVRMALEPGTGASAVPIRTSVAGAAIAVAAIATALTFGASLNRLIDTPRLYGQTWDVQFGDNFNPDVAAKVYPLMRSSPFIDAFAGGTIDEATVDGHHVGVLALQPVRGTIGPALVEGRAPVADDEVLLDPRTLDDTGIDVGSDVSVAVANRTLRMRVVGSGVLSDVPGAQSLLGNSALLTYDGFRRLAPGARRNFFFANLAPGVDEREAMRSLARYGPLPRAEPIDVANYDRVESVPFVAGGLLALVGVAMLLHTLVTSVRTRRRDLGILKVLGFERRQVSRVVAWQATTIVALAALIGVPVGVAAGRWGWTIFAHELGVVADPVVPLVPVLLLIPAAVLLANLLAAAPAALAARTRPATVLRAE